MTEPSESTIDVIVLRFDNSISHGDIRDVLYSLQQKLEDPRFGFKYEEPIVDGAAARDSRDLHSGLEVTQLTIAVSSIAALVKVLVELLRSRRITLEIEYRGRRLRYEGPGNPELENRLRALLTTDSSGRK